MPVLDDPIHEEACQLRAGRDGVALSQVAAYAQAFKVPEDSEANNSSRFFRQPHIRARVVEIRTWRTKLADLNEGWILVHLKAIAKNAKPIANANLDDYFARNADGQRLGISLTDVSRAKMAVLEEVTVEEYVEGRGEDAERIKRTKVKLRSSNEARAALELLGKHLGMWPNRVSAEVSGPNGGPIETKNVSDAMRARALAAFMAKTAGRARKPEGGQ